MVDLYCRSGRTPIGLRHVLLIGAPRRFLIRGTARSPLFPPEKGTGFHVRPGKLPDAPCRLDSSCHQDSRRSLPGRRPRGIRDDVQRVRAIVSVERACTARGGCEKGLRQIMPGARRWVGGPRFGVCISTGGRTTLEDRAVMCTMLLVMLRTAIENRAVDIAHHRADVPRRVARARLAGARLEVLYVPAPQTRGAWGGGGREGAFRRCLSHF